MNVSRTILFRSPQLKLFLRLVKSPSHMLFLASNLAILVHLQYFSATRLLHYPRGDREKLDRLRAQTAELRDLEEEERRIKEEIEALKGQLPNGRRNDLDQCNEARGVHIRRKELCRKQDNMKLVSKFDGQRSAIFKSLLKDVNIHNLFAHRFDSGGSFDDDADAPSALSEATYVTSPDKRIISQVILRCLIGDLITETTSGSEVMANQTERSTFGGKLLRSIIFDANSRLLTYEDSDMTKFINCTTFNVGRSPHIPKETIITELEAAFDSFILGNGNGSKRILLLNVARSLTRNNASAFPDDLILFLYHKFGLLKLYKYQAMLLTILPNLRIRIERSVYDAAELLADKEPTNERTIRLDNHRSMVPNGQHLQSAAVILQPRYLCKSVAEVYTAC